MIPDPPFKVVTDDGTEYLVEVEFRGGLNTPVYGGHVSAPGVPYLITRVRGRKFHVNEPRDDNGTFEIVGVGQAKLKAT